ncbi:MAG: IS1380 family transposase [Bacteroidota bacterium]
MNKFDVEFTKESLISNAGLILFFSYLEDSILRHFLSPTLSCGNPNYIYSDFDIIRSFLAMQASGHSNFEDLDFFRSCSFFKQVIGDDAIVSKERFRQRLDLMALHNSSLIGNLSKLNQFLLKQHAQPKSIPAFPFIPLDFDVTIFDNSDSHKQGVRPTYQHNIDGYAPMMTYLGHQGYLLNHQFRSGNFHANCKGTLEYILQTVKLAKGLTDQPILARFDSGNDSMINAIHLSKIENLNFIIKRNIRSKQYREMMIKEVLEQHTYCVENQQGIKIYHFEKTELIQYFDKDVAIQADVRKIFSLIERKVDKYGQLLLVPVYDLHAWWTDLDEKLYPIESIIELYKDHATSEQFHSEYKTELDIEKLPSGKFLTNELILALSQITYNIMRFIGQKVLACDHYLIKRKVSRLKIKTVLRKIIGLPAKYMIKNRRACLKIPLNHPFSETFKWLYLKSNFV